MEDIRDWEQGVCEEERCERDDYVYLRARRDYEVLVADDGVMDCEPQSPAVSGWSLLVLCVCYSFCVWVALRFMLLVVVEEVRDAVESGTSC